MFKPRHRVSLDSYFESEAGSKKIDKKKLIRIAAIIIAAILVMLVVGGIFFLMSKSEDAQNAKWIKRASRHLLLPEEKPALVEIKDSTQLIQEQPFYQGTIDGDILLIFTEAKKAVIYSPSRDIIINAGPIYAGQEMEGLK